MCWPPVLGLFTSVVITLTYIRRNRVQQELAETYGVSQPTVSRAVKLPRDLGHSISMPRGRVGAVAGSRLG
ncbi:transposase family protein [Streptomyces olivoreticuli]